MPTHNKLSVDVDGFAVSGKKVGFVSQYYNGAYVTHNINKLNVEEVDSFAVSERKKKGLILWVSISTVPTHNKLSVEEVDSFVIPRVLVLKVHCVQHVLDEGHGNHRQQDGILQKSHSAILHPVKDRLLLTMTAAKV